MTQNIRRTIDAIYRFPELRFTADLSPWYVGHDLPSGDFDAKAAFLSPFFERVRLIQGRIGTPTCMQVNLTGADDARPFVDDYRRLWRECFFGFLAHADPAEEIAFAPELLPWIADFNGIAQHLYFAPTQRNAEGLEIETGDRWQQAGYLVDIGRTVFAEVCSRT
ncbi:hypothetical protein [Sphingomonas sp. DBB INV C78]|uniref:hypothetical protein n=1 Tax=Sphingomonas sp. DBB INV C78 TaxID=3349434 RepID=UPI0036D342A8